MKILTKFILITLILIPITAYLDAILIRGMSFQDYLYVCTWEMLIFIIGILTGFQILKKELKTDTIYGRRKQKRPLEKK